MSAMNDMLESEFQLQQEIKSLRQQLLLKEHHYDVMKASAEVLAEQCEKYRQQLATTQEALENEQAKGIHSCHTNCTMEGCVNRKLRQQLADSQKREVMLRQSLSNLLWAASERDKKNRIRQFDGFMENAREALAATADLKDVILCHAEPFSWYSTELDEFRDDKDQYFSLPVYRAWEPK